MPTYEYACRECGHQLEIFQSMRDDPLTDCPECGKPALKRLIGTGAGIIFKGSGFYETDYKRADEGKNGKSASGAKETSESGGSSETAAKADTGKSDTSAKKDASASASGTSGTPKPTPVNNG